MQLGKLFTNHIIFCKLFRKVEKINVNPGDINGIGFNGPTFTHSKQSGEDDKRSLSYPTAIQCKHFKTGQNLDNVLRTVKVIPITGTTKI